jgi:hypothetical protein
MTVMTLWLLIAVSDASNNRGNVSVVERFATQQECFNVRVPLERLADGSAKLLCVEAKVSKAGSTS